MNPMQSLAALAIVPLLAGPTFGNPCRVCAVPVVKKKAVVVKRDIVKVVKEVQAVVSVFQPVYLAQVVPAPAYTVNLTVPQPAAPPVQQTFIAPPSISTSAAFQRTATYTQNGQQQAAYGQAYSQPLPQPPPPQQLTANTTEQRLDRLEAAIANLCETLKANGVRQENGNGNGKLGPIPRSLGTSCVRCHSATQAAKDGGGFVIYDRGSLSAFSQLDLRNMARHVRAGTMPPPNNSKGVPPLTPADQKELLDWLDAQE